MNKNYRSIYNEATGTWVAVSEAAKSNGKKTKNAQQALNLVAAGMAGAVAFLAPNTAVASYAAGNGTVAVSGIAISDTSSVAAKSVGVQAIAIGPGAVATGDYSIALGRNAAAQDNQAIAIGLNSSAGPTSQAIGVGAVAAGTGGVALGTLSKIDSAAIFATALGNSASVTASYGVAVGLYAASSGQNAVAIGRLAGAAGEYSAAMGYKSSAATVNAIAIGNAAKVTASEATAIGVSATASGKQAIAIGVLSVASANGSLAAGVGATAASIGATALGNLANVAGTATYATAVGQSSSVTGQYGLAAGVGATAASIGATALGANTSATIARAVALGSSATTATNATTEASATLNGLTYGKFAGQVTDTGMQVSVGSAGAERQIKNVGSGAISATSTDAINGSQLYATNSVLGKVADSAKTILGGNAALAANGTITMTNIGGTGKNNVNDAIAAAKTTVTQGDNIVVSSSTNANGSTNYQVATSLTPTFTTVSVTGGATITSSGIDMGGDKITNVAAGTAATDAVNLSQLQAATAGLTGVIPPKKAST